MSSSKDEKKSTAVVGYVSQVGDDGWVNPNEASFEDPQLSWRYFRKVIPKAHFGVVKEDKVYGKKSMTYYNIFHREHPRASFTVIGPICKIRRAVLGLGNWKKNPLLKDAHPAVKEKLREELTKSELAIQVTRWSFDPHLDDGHGANTEFMEYIKFRRECQLWVAWWICNHNKVVSWVAEIKFTCIEGAHKAIVNRANGTSDYLRGEYQDGRKTEAELNTELARIEEKKKNELEALNKQPVDAWKMADLYTKSYMWKTYAFHLDKTDATVGVGKDQRDDGTYAKKQRTEGKAADKVDKPDSEFITFTMNPWRFPWPNEFKDAPYMPPDQNTAKVYEKTGMIYKPPAFYEIAKMGQQLATPRPDLSEEEAEKQRERDEAAAQFESIVNTFNRPLVDGCKVAIEYGLSVYLQATGKSGCKDHWKSTWFFDGPSEDDMARTLRWRAGGAAGSGAMGRNLTAMKPVKGAKPYAPTAEWGSVLGDQDAKAALALLADVEKAAVDEKKARDKKRQEADDKESKEAPGESAATPTASSPKDFASARKMLETIPEKSAVVAVAPPEYAASQDEDQSGALAALEQAEKEKPKKRSNGNRRSARSRSKEPEPAAPMPKLSLGRNKRKATTDD